MNNGQMPVAASNGLKTRVIVMTETSVFMQSQRSSIEKSCILDLSILTCVLLTYNGETVLVIYSSELSQRVAEDIKFAMKLDNSWRLSAQADKLQWIDQDGDALDHEPVVSWWRRFKSYLISLLPIEKYL